MLAPFLLLGCRLDETEAGTTPAEAEAEDETGQTPEQEQESEKSEAKPSETPSETAKADDDDDEPKEWRDFASKFQHIEDEKERKAAAGKAYWEKTRYASQVRKENETLKTENASLKARGQTPPAEEKAKPVEAEIVYADPDLQKLEHRIGALDAEKAKIPEQRTALLADLEEKKADVAVLRYQLKVADELDKRAVQAQLDAAVAQHDAKVDRYRQLRRDEDGIADKLEELKLRRDQAKRFLDAEKVRQKQADADTAVFMKQYPVEFDSYLFDTADKLGIPKDDETRQDLWESANEAAIAALLRFNKGLGAPSVDDVDWKAIVASKVEKYAKRFDKAGRTSLAKLTTEKTEIVRKLSPTLKPRQAAPMKTPAERQAAEDETLAEMLRRPENARRAFLGSRR